jgi:hypothetical protein
LCEVGVPDVCTVQAGPYVGEWSHRVARKNGTWDAWNGVRACKACHRLIEAEPAWARSCGLRVPSWDDPRRIPVYLRLQPWWHGWWWLEEDGTYDHAHALDAAVALGFPEVPDYRRTA